MKVGDEVERIYEAGSGVITKDAGECFYVDWGNLTSLIPKGWLKLKNSKEEPKGHPNASILMEIAKEAAINPEYWKEFEWDGQSGNWKECGGDKPIYFLLLENYNIRRKPRTIRIGNYDVPEPIEIFTSDSDLCVRFDTHLDACAMQKALQELLGSKQ